MVYNFIANLQDKVKFSTNKKKVHHYRKFRF